MTTEFSLTSRFTASPKQVGGGFSQSPTITADFALADGTGIGEASAMWHDQLTIPTDGSQTLDLTSLPVTAFNISGNLWFWKIKSLYIKNTSNTTSVTVFAADEENDVWSALYAVPVVLGPGGMLVAMDPAGWLVANDSKTIRFENHEELVSFVGDATVSSAVIDDIEDTDYLDVGMTVSGTGIPAGAKIIAKTSTTITLSAAATATNAAVNLSAAPAEPVVVVSLAGVLD